MRTTPPPPQPVKEVEFPAISEDHLANGMPVMCVSDHTLPRTTFFLALPVGRIHDPDDQRGTGQLAAEMLKEGTKERSSRQIAESLDRLAIDLDVDVYMEHMLISATSLSIHLEKSVELVADLVQNPSFPEDELEKVRSRWRSLLASQRSDPAFLANERCFESLFPGHPYCRISIPIEHLERLVRETLIDFHSGHYPSDGAALLFAGSVTRDEAVNLAQRYFENWTAQKGPRPVFPDKLDSAGTRVELVHRPESVQARIMVGVHALPRSAETYLPLKLTNQVYGGGASARLFLNLREDKGFTYGVYSSLRGYSKGGVLLVGTSVRSDKTAESVREILNEMLKMQNEPPTEEELDRSKAEIAGSFIRRMESASSIGSLELDRRLSGLPKDYYTRYLPIIRGVTSQEIVRNASRFLRTERSLIVVVGDRQDLEDSLAQFGELRVFDTMGNQLE